MWINLRDIFWVELANLVIICRGETEKGIEKNVQGSDMVTWEKGNSTH